jgi:tight adherence protein B
MIHHMQLQLMLLAGFLGLSGLGFTALLVMQGQTRQLRLNQRFESATKPHLRNRRIEPPRLLRNVPTAPPSSPFGRVAGLFGFDVQRLDQYPTKWFMVLGVTLLVARVADGILISLIGNLLWLALPVIWVMLSRTLFKMMLQRRRARLYSQFPDCLTMIVRSVRAGLPLTEAIKIVGHEVAAPSAAEFSRVAGDLAIGISIQDALTAMADRNDITEFRFFATALALQSQTGGRLGETLENLASIVRKRMALKSRAKALASEARTTAMILGCLPLVAAAGLYALNPDYLSLLFTEHMGHLILMAAGLSLATGALIMRIIIEKSLA